LARSQLATDILLKSYSGMLG